MPVDFIRGYEDGEEGDHGFPMHLRQYVPNRYAKPLPWWRDTDAVSYFMHSMVLMTCRHVEDGDELVRDYRLDPDDPNLPSWYSNFDEVAARLSRRPQDELFDPNDFDEKGRKKVQ